MKGKRFAGGHARCRRRGDRGARGSRCGGERCDAGCGHRRASSSSAADGGMSHAGASGSSVSAGRRRGCGGSSAGREPMVEGRRRRAQAELGTGRRVAFEQKGDILRQVLPVLVTCITALRPGGSHRRLVCVQIPHPLASDVTRWPVDRVCSTVRRRGAAIRDALPPVARRPIVGVVVSRPEPELPCLPPLLRRSVSPRRLVTSPPCIHLSRPRSRSPRQSTRCMGALPSSPGRPDLTS